MKVEKGFSSLEGISRFLCPRFGEGSLLGAHELNLKHNYIDVGEKGERNCQQRLCTRIHLHPKGQVFLEMHLYWPYQHFKVRVPWLIWGAPQFLLSLHLWIVLDSFLDGVFLSKHEGPGTPSVMSVKWLSFNHSQDLGSAVASITGETFWDYGFCLVTLPWARLCF